MIRQPSRNWVAYLAAIAAVAVAALSGALLVQFTSTSILYLTFFAGVAFAGWFGGLRPALLATVITYFVANWFFVPEREAFQYTTSGMVFICVCVLIAAFSELARNARRRAETSAQQVVSLVESINDGFIAVDNRWRCTYMNRAAEELARQHRQLSIGATLWDVFPLAAAHDANVQLLNAAKERTTVEFESYFEPWETWFEVKASPAEDRTMAIFFRDITERKLGQMALAQSEERLRLAQQGARAGLWDWNMQTNVVTWSDEYYEINGLERTVEPSQQNFLAAIYPEDRPKVEQATVTALANRQRMDIQYRIEHPVRGLRWIASRGHTTFDAEGQPLRTSGIVLDITERKRAEEALGFLSEAGNVLSILVDFESTMQSLARLAVQSIADYCVVDMISPLGRIERLAFAHRDLAQEPILKQALDLNPLDWSGETPVVQVLRSKTPRLERDVSLEMLDALANNDEHRKVLAKLAPVSWMIVPLLARDRVIGSITFANAESRRRYSPADLDLVTELARRVAAAGDNVRLYTELCESQRQKDDFLAMLAHELRNPLAAIQYANQVTKLSLPAEENPASDVIDRQVKTLAHLIDDLLDVSRITRDKIQLRKEVLDGRELLERALATVRPAIEERQHELVTELATQEMPLLADAVRVEQILVNLLSNAAKYTPEGGRILVRTFAIDGQAVFKIKDTGVGIAAEMLPRVFELFTQADRSLDRSQGGLGIGLTVVRKLAEMHGGSVSATSEGLGRGSEFTVRLPLTTAPSQIVVPAESLPALPTPQKILVVDDNVDMAQSLGKLLQQAGHTITTVYDGPSALEAAREFKPNVILLDIGLPGLDGYRVAEALRREPAFSQVRLVAVSGYGQLEDRNRAKAAGFDHHLVKPVDFAELTTFIAGH